jgi:hypothetical protein
VDVARQALLAQIDGVETDAKNYPLKHQFIA